MNFSSLAKSIKMSIHSREFRLDDAARSDFNRGTFRPNFTAKKSGRGGSSRGGSAFCLIARNSRTPRVARILCHFSALILQITSGPAKVPSKGKTMHRCLLWGDSPRLLVGRLKDSGCKENDKRSSFEVIESFVANFSSLKANLFSLLV